MRSYLILRAAESLKATPTSHDTCAQSRICAKNLQPVLPSKGARGSSRLWSAHLKRENDHFAALGVLHTGVAVGLEAREGGKRDLLLSRVL